MKAALSILVPVSWTFIAGRGAMASGGSLDGGNASPQRFRGQQPAGAQQYMDFQKYLENQGQGQYMDFQQYLDFQQFLQSQGQPWQLQGNSAMPEYQQYMSKYAAAYKKYLDYQQYMHSQGAFVSTNWTDFQQGQPGNTAPMSAADCQTVSELKAWHAQQLALTQKWVPAEYQLHAIRNLDRDYETNYARIVGAGVVRTSSDMRTAPPTGGATQTLAQEDASAHKVPHSLAAEVADLGLPPLPPMPPKSAYADAASSDFKSRFEANGTSEVDSRNRTATAAAESLAAAEPSAGSSPSSGHILLVVLAGLALPAAVAFVSGAAQQVRAAVFMSRSADTDFISLDASA